MHIHKDVGRSEMIIHFKPTSPSVSIDGDSKITRKQVTGNGAMAETNQIKYHS